MKNSTRALLILGLFASPLAAASPAAEVTKPITQFLDGFNKGDTKSAYAAFAPASITIIDEFAPHIWVGPKAPQNWAADYDKHAQKTAVTDGTVSYGKPTRTVVDETTAYVIIPTVYSYKENKKPTVEEGQMTFALHDSKVGWKITGWTWTGVIPHAPK